MDHFQLEIDRILFESNSAGISLRRLYELFKNHKRKNSLSYLCQRIGIPSKGYLSFVMSGKRRLHAKYWDLTCKTFKLNDQQEKILKSLLELDFIRCETERRYQQKRIQYLREENKVLESAKFNLAGQS